MTATAERPSPLTIEEYLEMESRSRSKHYCIKGQIIDAPGGTLKHNIISSNIVTAINIAIRQNAQSPTHRRGCFSKHGRT